MRDAGNRSYAAEREAAIMRFVGDGGFVSFRALEQNLRASPATIRRDLLRLARAGSIIRVHGGAKLPPDRAAAGSLSSVSPHPRSNKNGAAKDAIGRAAAELCQRGEAVIIGGGSTTLKMCPHLEGRGLLVLTNSLQIVNALLPQSTTRVTISGGAIFREQNAILSPTGEDLMPRFHATKALVGAAAVGPQGITHADVVLVAAERRLIERADHLIALVDSSKFGSASGHVVCGLDVIDTLVTDRGLRPLHREMLETAGIKVVIAG